MSSTLRGYIMTKARDIADGTSVDTSLFVQKDVNGVIEALDGSALTGIGGGEVLQVVNEIFTHDKSTSSQSYTTGADWAKASITPTAADSRIYVQFSSTGRNGSGGGETFYTIYRDDTVNLAGNTSGLCVTKIQDTGTTPLYMGLIDTPNTTNQVDYQIYMKQNYGVDGYYGRDGLTTFTLIEIAA